MSRPQTCEGGAAPAVEGRDLVATLQGWRERGWQRFDPVRFRFIEALARRAAACGGAARSRVEDRVAQLLAAYGRDLQESRWDAGRAGAPRATQDAASAPAGTVGQEGRPRPGALAGLVERLARNAPPRADGAAGPGVASELGALAYFRSTWARLSAERRVMQSLAKAPENAGPLNSQRLVHQSLMQMRALSPEYLRHFTTHVDALLWLEALQGARGGSAGKAAPAVR